MLAEAEDQLNLHQQVLEDQEAEVQVLLIVMQLMDLKILAEAEDQLDLQVAQHISLEMVDRV
jgi:hypothetical protein